MQHHDATTGTSHRFVILDHVKQLKQSMDIMTDVLSKLLLHDEEKEALQLVGCGPCLHETIPARGTEDAKSIHMDRVVDPQMGGDGVDLVVLNSLAWPVDALVSFVCGRSNAGVVQGMSTQIQSWATPLEDKLDAANLGVFLIASRATVLPLGQSRFTVKVCDLTWDTFQVPPAHLPTAQCANVAFGMSPDEVFQDGVSSDVLHLQFDSQTNDISSVAVKDQQISWMLSHDVVPCDGSNDNLCAIDTAIEDSDPTPLPNSAQIISACKGPLFCQAIVQENPPLVDLASRFQTNLTASSEWFCDKNGHTPVKAACDEKEAIGANI